MLKGTNHHHHHHSAVVEASSQLSCLRAAAVTCEKQSWRHMDLRASREDDNDDDADSRCHCWKKKESSWPDDRSLVVVVRLERSAAARQ